MLKGVQISFYVQDAQYSDDRDCICIIQENHEECQQRLATLRLVNRAFCKSASRRLLHNVYSAFDSGNIGNKPLEKLSQVSRSLYAAEVRVVTIGFMISWTPRLECEAYLRDLATLLPDCLSRLPGLTRLNIYGPNGMTWDDQPEPPFPQDLTQLFTDLIVKVLRYILLTAHNDLRLGFSMTHEFVQSLCNQLTVAEIPIDQIARRLRHLNVEICDYAGSDRDPNETSPVPAAKSRFPNMSSSFDTFGLVELANTLDSLYLRSTKMFDLEGFQFGHFLNLHTVYLARVAISSESLLSLVKQCKNSLRRIALERVELNDGTWEQVLMKMSQLPSLQYIYIDAIGYSATGDSSHLAPRQLPLMDGLEDIRTSNPLDHQARGRLERQINANRRAAQLLEFSQDYFRLEPLKNPEVPGSTNIR
jgi:hypothetical protein